MADPTGTMSPDNAATSSVPVLGEGFQDNNSPTIPNTTTTASGPESSEVKKRHFWQLGKKKEDKKKAAAAANTSTPTNTSDPSSALQSASATARSPSPTSPRMIPSSPNRIQGSPHIASPASSQIFERNVQEDVAASTASPAIPSHITTENHIPPVLDASSMAITDDHLNPDAVEIVTHAAHQPAAVTVASATESSSPPINEDHITSQAQLGSSPSMAVPTPLQHMLVGSDAGLSDDSASNYGNLDSTDVRRLSFISFADVVHAEQAASSGDHTSLRDSLLVSPGPTSAVASPVAAAARSPSPIRSPVSPPLSATSESASPRLGAIEGSPRASTKGLGLTSASPPPNPSELSVETMTQALRRTGSGDLSGAKGGEDGMDRLH